MSDEPSTFPNHLEAHLGPITEARSDDEEGAQPRIQILRFPDRPVEGAVTYVTLGLSTLDLHQERGHVRQELLVCRAGERTPFEAGGLLPAIAKQMLTSGDALRRGQVLGPAGPLLPGASCEAFLCWDPVYFDDALGEHTEAGDEVPILVVWLAPITAEEASFAEAHGWSAVVDVFEAEDADLLDWARPTLVHMHEEDVACQGCGQRHVEYRLTDGRSLTGSARA